MFYQSKKLTLVSVAVAALAGCGTVTTDVRKEIDQLQRERKDVIQNPLQIPTASRVSEVRGSLIPVTHVTAPRENEWLRLQKVALDIKNPTPLTAIVAMLAEQGINISSDLPLSSYTYVGKINQTDGETALKAMLGSVGLDYLVDDTRKLVVIKPMASRSWFINIGNRRSSYASDGQGTSGQAQSNSGTLNSSGIGNTSGFAGSSGMNTGLSGGMTTTANGSGNSNSSSTGAGVESQDDFWRSLSSELTNRLSIMLPRAMVASKQGSNFPTTPLPAGSVPGSPLPQSAPPSGEAPPTGGSELYLKRQIGSFALNPETGAITVQAPHWVLTDLDSYFTRVQDMYNTDISFIGEIVLVTSNKSDSEGVDISAFTKWAGGKYGAAFSNNALGGVTMSLPAAGGIQAAAQAVAGPLGGVTYSGARNAIDIFNAYLSEMGKVSVIQRPLITTTSGTPGVFSKKYTDYYNKVSQQAAAGGTGSAVTATQNEIVAVEYGTELKISPHIDISTGLVKAHLTLKQAIKSGNKIVPQTITFGNNTTTIPSSVPLITRQLVSGQVSLRDGELIIVGGQTEDNSSADENGLPGMDGPLGGLLGVKKASRGAQTYYFAMRVSVNKRK